jgi:N-methylhydantoinase B
MGEQSSIDAFTAEIIRESLVAVADEMFVSLQRTSQSTIIYEVLDFACGVTDEKAQLIAQTNGVTAFAGVLTFTVASVIEKFGPDRIREGDIFATNDPYSGGGTHLSDVAMVMPLFHRGVLMGFAANKAHWTEVGGKDAGSWTTDATEVYQEGLQFPCIRLYEHGEPLESLVDLIRANVRTPDMSVGDMLAQAAGLRMAARRFQEMCDKYGPQQVQAGIDYLLEMGERLVREDMRRLPRGTFTAHDFIDDDGLSPEPIPVQVKVTITDDQFTADFTGSGPMARGPVNCTRTGLMAGMRTIFKSITNPDTPINEGCFRPLQVICPEGNIFSAVRPAPVSTYWETLIYCMDLVWKALAPHLPERMTAGHFMSVCGTILAGPHSETGDLVIMVEPQAGGWGAGADKDGESGLVCVGDGETYIIPVEVCEQKYGVLVDQYALDPVDAGAGERRGGIGLVRDYRILSEDGMYLTATFGRHKYPPWGIDRGHDGSPNAIEILRADGSPPVRVGKTARAFLRRGDVARLITGTGGGWGDPKNRPRELVIEDVRRGYVSPAAAQEVYGLSPDDLPTAEAGS